MLALQCHEDQKWWQMGTGSVDHEAIHGFQRPMSLYWTWKWWLWLAGSVVMMTGARLVCLVGWENFPKPSLDSKLLSSKIRREEYLFMVTNLWYLQIAYFDNQPSWADVAAAILLFASYSAISNYVCFFSLATEPRSTKSFCLLNPRSSSERKVRWWPSMVCWRIFPLVLFLLFYFISAPGAPKKWMCQ